MSGICVRSGRGRAGAGVIGQSPPNPALPCDAYCVCTLPSPGLAENLRAETILPLRAAYRMRRNFRHPTSVSPQQRHQLALHLHPIGRKDPRFVSHVARLERDRIAAPPQPLQRDLGIVHQRNDDLAGLPALILRMMTVSPSRMPASIIELPATSGA